MDARVVRTLDDHPELSDKALLAHCMAWFDAYTSRGNVRARRERAPYTCPCCAHRTLEERGVDDICSECGWQDDGQDDHDAGVVRGGPNGALSLEAARASYMASGGIRGTHSPPGER